MKKSEKALKLTRLQRFGKFKKFEKILILVCIVLIAASLAGCSALKESATSSDSPLGGLLGNRQETVDIVLLLTVLTILPSILIMLTGFTRIIIVLSLIRNGLGLQQMPPNQVLIGLALFLTFFVMSPVIDDINKNAYQPYVKEQISQEQAVTNAMKPIRAFMLKQTYKTDLEFFVSASPNDKDKQLKNVEDVSTSTLIPAFITSELKRGFQIGFFIYIPFIVIDMIVASTLMSMGMMMLPPIVISLPFKLLLFVIVDGWTLTIKTLLASFS